MAVNLEMANKGLYVAKNRGCSSVMILHCMGFTDLAVTTCHQLHKQVTDCICRILMFPLRLSHWRISDVSVIFHALYIIRWYQLEILSHVYSSILFVYRVASTFLV